MTTTGGPAAGPGPTRVLVAGWFSFTNGSATAGDVMSGALVSRWLGDAGVDHDVAVAATLPGSLDWRTLDAHAYSHVVFVCGPFAHAELEAEFLAHFATCRLVGLGLSMAVPLEAWNPFDELIERDSSVAVHADLVFAARQALPPVVGLCLVEPHVEALVDAANAAIDRALAHRDAAVVRIDTRLPDNEGGLRGPAEVEAVVARMDALVTTRLHGLVLALKNGVPVVAVDAVPGGGKITAQCREIGWANVWSVDGLDDAQLAAALDVALSDAARAEARACAARAGAKVGDVRARLLGSFTSEATEERFRARQAPEGMRAFLAALPARSSDGPPPRPRRSRAARLRGRLAGRFR